MNHKEEIRTYLKELLEQKDDLEPFSDSSSLLNSGRIDSMDTVEILLFLEKKFGMHIESGSFQKSQMDSVDAIAALVEASASGSKRTG